MAKKRTDAPEELPVISKLDRPRNTLGLEPVIETEEQANDALEEMAYLQAYASAIQARKEMRIKKIQAAADKSCVVKIAGKKVPCGDRDVVLGKALKLYAQTHRPELQNADGKRVARSLKLAMGKIGWGKGRDAVVIVSGNNAKDVKEALEEITTTEDKPGIIARLQSMLSRVRLFKDEERRGCPADELFSVSVDFNATKTREAFQKKKVITADDLARLNLRFAEGEDEFFAEPTTFQPSRAAVPNS